METFLIYLIKASLGILLFYLFYYLVLRKETFYFSNRLYLISGLILAVLLPVFPISYTTPVALVNNSEFFTLGESSVGEFLTTTDRNSEMISAWLDPVLILSMIYIIGSGVFLLRLVLQTAYVAIQLGRGKKMRLHGVSVININRNIMPFSFFNTVIINIQEYSKAELSNIIAHEKVHIQERHWVDLLIIELITVVFWINPIVWLYEKSIKQNHEYLADQGVLLAGYHPGQYQALLINQLMGVKILGFTNNLNFSLNKKRMEMMKKEKSPGFKKVKLLVILPVIAMLVFAFAKPEFIMVEEVASTSNIEETTNENSVTTLVTQEELITIKGAVMTKDKIPLEGANVILEDANTGTFTNENGEFELMAPKKFGLIVSYIGYETGKGRFTFKDMEDNEGWVGIALKKGVFNIELPEITEEEIVDQPPPLPPPNNKQTADVWTIVEDMPTYKKGGMNKLCWDILQETEATLKKTKSRGKVLVGFTVTEEGKVTNVQIMKSADSKMLDASAVKIVQKLDNWNPGIQRGKPVKVDLTVPVKFE